MKFIVNLLVIAAAGFLGYALEPNLRMELTGISQVSPQKKQEPGNQQEQVLSKIDVRAYDFEQLPKQVTLKKAAEVTDSASGVKMTIPEGTTVKLVRLGMGTLVISPGVETISGEVEVQNTDIREQLFANPPAPIDPKTLAKGPQGEPGMGSMGGAEPAEEEKPTDEMAQNGEGGSNPALAPAETEPAAPAEFSAMSQDDIVKVMQESIKSGQVTSFKLEDVSEWTAGEPEELNGAKFNVGMITYTGTTFMGKSQLRGKAYISGGKVHNWINPKSGTDLK